SLDSAKRPLMLKTPFSIVASVIMLASPMDKHGVDVTPVACSCAPNDIPCRISNCSGIGSGTGTGNSGTNNIVRPNERVKQERLDGPTRDGPKGPSVDTR